MALQPASTAWFASVLTCHPGRAALSKIPAWTQSVRLMVGFRDLEGLLQPR